MNWLRSTGLAVALVASWPLSARAAEADEERGKRLYDEGQTAMASKQYDVACAKFEESYRASGIAGALLNWADCEETRGRVATALALWNDGSAKVIRDPSRRQFVEQRISAIKPRVPMVRLTVATTGLEGVHATVDGVSVDPSKPVPVDPGLEHTLVVGADGYVDETTHVKLDFGESRELRVLEHPVRAPSSSPHGDKKGTEPARASRRGRRDLVTAGFVTGGIGLVGLAGFGATSGAVLGLCKGHLGRCPSSERGTVNALGVVNGVSLGLGIAGVGVGTVLLVVGQTGRDEPAPTTSVYVGPSGLGVAGSF